jgi:hypothetical protein
MSIYLKSATSVMRRILLNLWQGIRDVGRFARLVVAAVVSGFGSSLAWSAAIAVMIHLRVLRALFRPRTLHVSLTHQGVPMAPSQQQIATVTEFDAQDVLVPIVAGNIRFAIVDPAVAVFTLNADGTATIIAVAPGSTTLTATDTGNGLTGEVSITVVAAEPVPVPDPVPVDPVAPVVAVPVKLVITLSQ